MTKESVSVPTLHQFLGGCIGNRFLFGRNAHVRVPGFSSFYVRYGRRFIGGQMYHDVLDIASVAAEVTGKGHFKKVWQGLLGDYPAVHLYVENVMTERFREFFRKEGLLELPSEMTSSFFLKRSTEPKTG